MWTTVSVRVFHTIQKTFPQLWGMDKTRHKTRTSHIIGEGETPKRIHCFCRGWLVARGGKFRIDGTDKVYYLNVRKSKFNLKLL
jgi:hypothetical protein